jgi:hypothetical protein
VKKSRSTTAAIDPRTPWGCHARELRSLGSDPGVVRCFLGMSSLVELVKLFSKADAAASPTLGERKAKSARRALDDLVLSVTSGHGQFDAIVRLDGSINFAGELDSVSHSMVSPDQSCYRLLAERAKHRGLDLPLVTIRSRTSGEAFMVPGLRRAFLVMHATRCHRHHQFDVDAWSGDSQRRATEGRTAAAWAAR